MNEMNHMNAPWLHQEVLGFDTETTGVFTSRDRIATVSLIRRTNGEDVPLYWVINPGVPMPPAAGRVNGLTDEYLQSNGVDPRVGLEEVAGILAETMLRGVPVVGFNVTFDFAILEAELKRHGLQTLRQRLEGQLEPIVDPLVLDRILDRYRKGKRNLASVCTAYDLPLRDDFHNAQADVAATLDLLSAMSERFPELLEMGPGEIMRFQAEGHSQWAQSFNEFMAARKPDFHPVSLRWPQF